MFLYHVTFDLNHRGVFTPRVPENAEDYDENTEIPRICFAPSLEGCLSSMPQGGHNLDMSLKDTDNIIKVFRLDPLKYGIKPSNLLTPQTLHMKGYVTDAWATGEYWVTQPVRFTGEDIFYLRVLSYENACLGKEGLKPLTHHTRGDIDVIVNVKTIQIG